MKPQKTNAARLLDEAGIFYEIVAYDVDEKDLSAVHAAICIGQAPAQIFKTLVLRGDKTGPFVCVVPAPAQVDLKKAAKASGNKNAAMIPMKELFPLTGYMRGGCSPVGMKKQFPTLFHKTCLDFAEIYVSAGRRGVQLKISPQELIDFVHGSAADIAI